MTILLILKGSSILWRTERGGKCFTKNQRRIFTLLFEISREAVWKLIATMLWSVIEIKSRRFGHCEKLSKSFKAQNLANKDDFNWLDINKKRNTGQPRYFLYFIDNNFTVKSYERNCKRSTSRLKFL